MNERQVYAVGALNDPVLTKDVRVLSNLLKLEEHYYYPTVAEITQKMRDCFSDWATTICDRYSLTPSSSLLALYYLNRYLTMRKAGRDNYPRLAAACILIASKIQHVSNLTAKRIHDFIENPMEVKDIVEWELKVLEGLNWDTSAVTASDFIEFLFARFNYDQKLDFIQQAITLATTHNVEYGFAFKPSIVAACCVAEVIKKQCPGQSQEYVHRKLQKSINCDEASFLACRAQISL